MPTKKCLFGVLHGTKGKLNASNGITYVYSETSPCGTNMLLHAATTCVWHVCTYSRKLHTYEHTYVPSHPTKVLLKQLEGIKYIAVSPDNGSNDSSTDYAQELVGTPTYE